MRIREACRHFRLRHVETEHEKLNYRNQRVKGMIPLQAGNAGKTIKDEGGIIP